MSLADNPSDLSLLSTLVPIDALSPDHLPRLAREVEVEVLPRKSELFHQHDCDPHAVYLLAGEVALSSDRGDSMTVTGGTAQARYALANLKPRRFTATARTEARIVRIESELLDKLLAWDQLSGIEVTEFEGDASDSVWMTRMLQTRAFLRLPAANIQALFARMQAVEVKSGQLVIRQGDAGDYFYIVKQGRCRVMRKTAPDGPGAVVAELSVGDAFGEEALLSDQPRNATVAMTEDGILMRLAKADFDALLKQPALTWVDSLAAAELTRAGAAVIDVRLETEFAHGSIRGSVNLPLNLVRARAGTLDRGRVHVVVCDSGQRSAAAAFLLGEAGIDARVLRGGLGGLARPAAHP